MRLVLTKFLKFDVNGGLVGVVFCLRFALAQFLKFLLVAFTQFLKFDVNGGLVGVVFCLRFALAQFLKFLLVGRSKARLGLFLCFRFIAGV